MTTRTKLPNPLYAAAGASDVAFDQLRKLPATVAKLRTDLRHRAEEVQDNLAGVDLEQVRKDARRVMRRNAYALIATVQEAGVKAAEVYTDLVARGERVVNGEPVKAEPTPVAERPAKVEEPKAVDAKPAVRKTVAKKATSAVK